VITESLLNLASGLLAWIIGAVPNVSTPSWLSISTGDVSWLSGAVQAVGGWVPFGVIGAVLATYLIVHAAAIGVKIARQILSYVTLGGGAT